MRTPGLRRRLFWTLFLTALVPAAVTLAAGTVLLRETVATTGSAGPWATVAESGRHLLDVIAQREPDPELAEAAARHRSVLSESLRLSQVYALVGERIVILIPLAGVLLLVLVAGVAALATRRFALVLAAPAEELADWIQALGRGDPLPTDDDVPRSGDVAEFRALRRGLRDASRRLREARERELREARARSWADMARRVAHEIKNPLTPMRMAAERLARSPDPSAAETAEVLLEEIRRLDGLARSFSHFGQPMEGPPADVDLNDLLLGLHRRLRAEGAKVRVRVPEQPVVIRGHLEALERVVRNLVSNALEAQELPGAARPSTRPGGRPLRREAAGTSRVDTSGREREVEGVQAEPAPVEVLLEREGDRAVLTVEDRGPGIPSEILERIWEPDFTTRRRGTGLGLPLVRQAVKSHGGSVRAENRPGGGARFRVVLPLGDADASGANDTTSRGERG